MEAVSRVVEALKRAANSNAVINVCLVGSFAALCLRSVNHQKDIDALEAEKQTLIQSNKALKNTMWDWKQQLFAEAADSDTALIPLSRLRIIYGESTPLLPTAGEGSPVMEDDKSPSTRFIV